MDKLHKMFGRYLGTRNLNLGCAKNKIKNFVNLDCDPNVEPDILHDLEITPLPFPDEYFDCVFASHVMEHIHRLVPLMEDIHRILRPGGFLVAITPYISSDDALDSPHHVRVFSENTWAYFDQRLYRVGNGHAGYGATQNYRADFRIEQVVLVPHAGFIDDPGLEFKKRHHRNVIRELQAILRRA